MSLILHEQSNIGFKKLTDADLGRSINGSNQTHIGLSQKALKYLPNNIEIDDAILIYDGNFEFLPLSFDRIETSNHKYRSPKIRIGGQNAVSIVSFIRNTADRFPNDTQWYLIWFGLDNGHPVIVLFSKESTDYENISKIIDLTNKGMDVINNSSSSYSKLIEYLSDIVIKAKDELHKNLEIDVQLGQEIPPCKEAIYHVQDFEKAAEEIKRIGREGEELINYYLHHKLMCGEIKNYNWVNNDTESGKPYDFNVQCLNDEIVYIDVKTTKYSFDQKFIFSSQEVNFSLNSNYKYSIYRVYTKGENKYLRICNNSKSLFSRIYTEINAFENTMLPMADINTIKMAISPSREELIFSEAIKLN